jgi:hypothetical protein
MTSETRKRIEEVAVSTLEAVAEKYKQRVLPSPIAPSSSSVAAKPDYPDDTPNGSASPVIRITGTAAPYSMAGILAVVGIVAAVVFLKR